MEASNFCNGDNNEKALKALFEAFGPVFSLQDITSAYHKADKKADLAREILFQKQGSASTSSEVAPSGQPKFVESSRQSNDSVSDKSRCKNGNFKAPKQKWRPVSGGTVSSMIGKDYIKPMPTANGCVRAKPTKLDTKVLPASLLWGEETGAEPSKNGQMRKDTEDFLFRMLGDGFQLEKDVIQQVLDNCGYDMQKRMENLLDLPEVNMDEGDKCVAKSTEKTSEVHSSFEYPAMQKSVQPLSLNGGMPSNLTADGNPQQEKRNVQQKEVLAALFYGAEESEESVRRSRAGRRCRALGELVVEPPREIPLERKASSVVSKQENNDEDDEEDAYLQLRAAVKEYRATMKEYYKAAVAAFAKGDHDLADKLMDKGQFFHEKAQKADEESRQKIFETKNVDTQDEVVLDLHDHTAKEAYRLLKHHLSLYSGIATIKYLKVILETEEEDTSKGARRRLVIKLLEKESIEWKGGEDDGIILVCMDNINRKALSCSKA